MNDSGCWQLCPLWTAKPNIRECEGNAIQAPVNGSSKTLSICSGDLIVPIPLLYCVAMVSVSEPRICMCMPTSNKMEIVLTLSSWFREDCSSVGIVICWPCIMTDIPLQFNYNRRFTS